MIEANNVRHEMNRCGKEHRPFLFGVDFEINKGFFIEDPLNDKRILFKTGAISNMGNTLPPCPTPQLEILHTDAAAYASKFEIVHNGLLYGNSFLLNLTERTPIRTNLTLEQIFYHSRAKYKVLLPDRFVCFSPESFVRIQGNEISTYPMKGTIDATLPNAETLLMNNYKEECEHYTIVDLLRNDLNMVAQNIQVRRFRYVENIRTLKGEILQTSSEVVGRLPDNWHNRIGEIIFRLLPAGSISGAPKPSTVKLIQDAEGITRGYYSGAFGYFDGHSLDSAVMIRFIEKEGGQYFFRSGGGITINSKAEEEYEEVLEKIYLSI